MSDGQQIIDRGLWRGWRHASSTAEVDRALRDLYAELDAAIAAKGPTCWSSGKCCKFDAFGHRLYVTGLEIAWFLYQVEQVESDNTVNSRAEKQAGSAGLRLPQLAEWSLPLSGGECPYQLGGLCSTHAIRPLGCRIFFCQQGTEAWQQDLYESFLKRLQNMHDDAGIEYRYMDWVAGLSEAAAAAPRGGG